MIKTIISDIDGCIFRQVQNLYELGHRSPEILPGVIEKFQEWHEKGYYIILVTARPESCRSLTINHLDHYGLCYHQLIMGVGRGERVLINDIKPSNGELRARAINIERNKGFSELSV